MPVKDEWSPRPPVVRREGPTEPGLQVNWHFYREANKLDTKTCFYVSVYEKLDIATSAPYLPCIE